MDGQDSIRGRSGGITFKEYLNTERELKLHFDKVEVSFKAVEYDDVTSSDTFYDTGGEYYEEFRYHATNAPPYPDIAPESNHEHSGILFVKGGKSNLLRVRSQKTTLMKETDVAFDVHRPFFGGQLKLTKKYVECNAWINPTRFTNYLDEFESLEEGKKVQFPHYYDHCFVDKACVRKRVVHAESTIDEKDNVLSPELLDIESNEIVKAEVEHVRSIVTREVVRVLTHMRMENYSVVEGGLKAPYKAEVYADVMVCDALEAVRSLVTVGSNYCKKMVITEYGVKGQQALTSPCIVYTLSGTEKLKIYAKAANRLRVEMEFRKGKGSLIQNRGSKMPRHRTINGIWSRLKRLAKSRINHFLDYCQCSYSSPIWGGDENRTKEAVEGLSRVCRSQSKVASILKQLRQGGGEIVQVKDKPFSRKLMGKLVTEGLLEKVHTRPTIYRATFGIDENT